MALGCAFIFMLVVMLCRRRMRKRRAKRTGAWAASKRLDPKTTWHWRLLRFGEKLFGHRASPPPPPPPISMEDVESEATILMEMRNAEEARIRNDKEKLEVFGAYEYSRAGSTRSSRSSATPSVLPPFAGEPKRDTQSLLDQMSRGSIYSELTGVPRNRNAPEPRQPVKNLLQPNLRRYPSTSTTHIGSDGSYMYKPEAYLFDIDVPAGTGSSAAQAYANTVRSADNNPFRRWL